MLRRKRRCQLWKAYSRHPGGHGFYGMQENAESDAFSGGSWIRGKTLIINLPGSVKGESLEAITPALAHGLGILRGDAQNAGSLWRKNQLPCWR